MKHGYEMCVVLATGTKVQREMLQDALNRWWTPIMMFHGPSDKESKHTEQLVRWRVKLKTNDEQRQQFLKQFVPKMLDLGLRIPDKSLRFDKDRDEWVYDDPDWTVFKKVVNNGGPVSHERIEARRLAHRDGQWVREALAAAAENRVIPMPASN